jgi:protein TonB
MALSLAVHVLFFIIAYPIISVTQTKPNVPVMVRIITDLPKPRKEEPPIKKKTAALSDADRRAQGPKELERSPEPKIPKVRIMAKVVPPTERRIVEPTPERPEPVKQKLEVPKPRKTLLAAATKKPKPQPKLITTRKFYSQGVPQLRKLPLLSGADLERYAKLDPEAQESEVVSLDTRDFRYISYFATIKRQIELVWTYPEEAARAGIYGELLLQFTILRDGHLEEVRLMRSSGSRILDEEAIRAVKAANPYNPFPKRIKKNRLRINAVFSYLPAYSALR